MTLLVGFLALSALVGFWLYAVERGLRLAADHECDLIHSDYLALQQSHEIALDDLDDMVEAITLNSMSRHPAGRLSLVKGHGA